VKSAERLVEVTEGVGLELDVRDDQVEVVDEFAAASHQGQAVAVLIGQVQDPEPPAGGLTVSVGAVLVDFGDVGGADGVQGAPGVGRFGAVGHEVEFRSAWC
jgi:hypothetical protein